MRRKLLIVDDSPLIRRMVVDALGPDFDEVEHAVDGLDALEAVARDTPSLVVLDVEMPRLGGLDTCRQMRTIAPLQDVPIVVLTSRESDADAEAAYAAAATDFVVKPFAPGLLRARLRTWLLRGSEA